MTPQEQILANYGKLRLRDANEAETRLKVIDRILRDVLGWTDDDLTPEEHVSEDGISTFADYVLRTANIALVVEAKKIGAAFDCSSDKRRIKLAQSFLQGDLGDAIKQARDYARKLSIDYAVATNGDAWIVFAAQRHDQVTFNESTALVFGSLREILRDGFGEFRDLLSRDAVISGSLETALLGRSHDQVGSRKLGHAFSGSLRAIRSNPLYPLIEDAIATAFSDLINELEGDLLDRSYVATPETMRFDSKIQLQVTRRAADLGLQPTRPMKPSEADSFRDRLKSAANRHKPLAILLLGTVGAGKTTFLSYTRKVKAADLFRPRADAPYPHWIYVDFLNYAPSVSASRFIYDHLFQYIQGDAYLGDFKRCIRKAYEEEITSLRRGPLFLLSSNEERINEEITAHIRQEYEKREPYVDRIPPVATSNSSTRGHPKLLHPWQRDGGTLFGRIAFGNLNR